MVLNYYNLREQPFGVTSDPRYLYLSASHREALASLAYGIQSRRGFMSLIAKPGMGKTTILFELLSQLENSARTVFLFQTLCSPEDLLRDLLRDLGVVDDAGNDIGSMQEQLNRVLVAEARQGRRVVVVIDEAQNLEDSALELLRMLSNFETTSHKLMEIVLAGQPHLGERLTSPRLLQLRQRVSIAARIQPLSVEETRLYMRHRLRVAGYDSKTSLFTSKAEALVAKYSEGVPRNINNICFNALSLGCVLKQKSIREEVIRECLDDLDLDLGGANDRDEQVAARNLVALGAREPATVSRQPFAWRRRLAVCVVLFVQLLCFTGGRQSPGVHYARSLLGASSTSQTVATSLSSAMPANHPSPTVLGVDELNIKSALAPSADETSEGAEAVLSSSRDSVSHTVSRNGQASPPASGGK